MMIPYFVPFTLLLWALLATSAAAETREYDFNVAPQWIAPDGYWREAYTINGQTPGPLISADEGDTIRVHVVNNLNIPITFHWHGIHQSKTPWMDGVPGVNQWPILPKDRFTYEFEVEQYGSYWYHSHTIGTYDDGIRGAMIIHPKPDRPRPWAQISNVTEDQQDMEEAMRRALNFQGYGWLREMSEVGLVQWKSSGALPICFESLVVNGFGRVHCPSQDTLASEGKISSLLSTTFEDADVKGCMRSKARNRTQENPVRCEATDAPFALWKSSTYSSPDGRYMAMHLINAGTDVSLSISIDGHSMYVFMVDGQFVEPQRVQVANVKVGSRISVIIPLDQGKGDYVIRAATSDIHQFQILSWFGILRVDSEAKVDPSAKDAMKQQMKRFDSTVVNTMPILFTRHDRRDLRQPGPTGGISIDQIESPNVNTGNTTQLIESINDEPDAFVRDLGSTKGTRWITYGGSPKSGANVTNDYLFSPIPATPPPSGPAHLTIKAEISANPITWRFAFSGHKGLHTFQTPLLFKSADTDVQEYQGTIYDAKMGDIVDLIFYTLIPVDHPLHKHHLPMWVIAHGNLTDGAVPWNTTEEGIRQAPGDFNMVNPPIRDTVYLKGGSYVVMRYKVEFAATSLFHCHIQHHQAAGMSIIVREGLDAFDENSIPDRIRNAAHVSHVRTNMTSINGLDTA